MDRDDYATLTAMRDGRGYRLWPMQRRRYVRRGWIEATGPAPEPSEHRRASTPVRPYRVTRKGRRELRKYERARHAEQRRPMHAGPMRLRFGKDDPCVG